MGVMCWDYSLFQSVHSLKPRSLTRKGRKYAVRVVRDSSFHGVARRRAVKGVIGENFTAQQDEGRRSRCFALFLSSNTHSVGNLFKRGLKPSGDESHPMC